MSKVKYWFLNQNMSWLKVIIFAIITGVVTALLKVIPVLEETSFQDIAITYDCWILFAVFIIVNCNKWWEASLKTFVFFLISQPLIFLLQVPFNGYDFSIFIYYPYWFIITILTLPGAAIAYQLKRRDWLSLLVLAVAEAYYGYAIGSYIWTAVYSFPHHLISIIFCVLCSLFFAYIFFDKKWMSVIAVAVMLLTFIVSAFILKPVREEQISLPEGEWSYSLEDDSIIDVEKEDDNDFKVFPKEKGSTIIKFKDKNGNIKEYEVTITSGMYINEITG